MWLLQNNFLSVFLIETQYVICEFRTDSVYRMWFNYRIQGDKHSSFLSLFDKIVNLHMNKEIDFRHEATQHLFFPGGVTPRDAL
jgi:hypothetical protein